MKSASGYREINNLIYLQIKSYQLSHDEYYIFRLVQILQVIFHNGMKTDKPVCMKLFCHVNNVSAVSPAEMFKDQPEDIQECMSLYLMLQLSLFSAMIRELSACIGEDGKYKSLYDMKRAYIAQENNRDYLLFSAKKLEQLLIFDKSMLDVDLFIRKRAKFLTELVFAQREQMKFVIPSQYWDDNQSQREEIDQGLQKILQFKPQFSLSIKDILQSDELNEADIAKITEVLTQIINGNYINTTQRAVLLLADIFSQYKGTDTDLVQIIDQLCKVMRQMPTVTDREIVFLRGLFKYNCVPQFLQYLKDHIDQYIDYYYQEAPMIYGQTMEMLILEFREHKFICVGKASLLHPTISYNVEPDFADKYDKQIDAQAQTAASTNSFGAQIQSELSLVRFVTSKDVNSLLGDFKVEEHSEKEEMNKVDESPEPERPKDDIANLFETAEAFTNLKRI